jgi:hypothetical protein
MIDRRIRQRIFETCCVLSIVSLPHVAIGQSCLIDAGRVGDLRIGATKAEIVATLSSRYVVNEQTQPGAAPTLVGRRRSDAIGSGPAVVVNLDGDRAFLIDSYERCATKEGVGPGTTLGHAQAAYGRGQLDSTDLGYFVWFDRKKGVMFLLEDKDIPSSLRRLPDDVLTPAQESKILEVSKARILAVRVAAR